jgi:hypothetical protein
MEWLPDVVGMLGTSEVDPEKGNGAGQRVHDARRGE